MSAGILVLLFQSPAWLCLLVYLFLCFSHLHGYMSAGVLAPLFQSPAWLCLLVAVSIFIYQTLDCMDGTQEVSTGCESPLGMLYDHGFDSIYLQVSL